MQLRHEALADLDATRRFFARTLACLEERDSLYRATPETMTVASHVAHAAQVIDWFREGALADRWDMDFPALQKITDEVTSLAAARRWLDDAWERLLAAVAQQSEERLAETLADNPILPGKPRFHVVSAVVDHTGHHRGALAVYARLLGRAPAMPYADEPAVVAG